MNTSELLNLCSCVQTQVAERRIPEMYASLSALLQNNLQPNQPRRPFEAEKVALIEAIKSVPLWVITQQQLAFLEKLNLGQHLGQQGADEIEDILFRNALDIATAAGRLQQNSAEINSAIAKFNQIRTGLSGVVEVSQSSESDEVLLRVKFSGEAEITDVVNLRAWADAWHTIGRGIAMAHNLAPESFKVIGASNGSIVIEMAVAVALAKTTSAIILEALKVADRVLDITKKAQEVVAMRLTNKKIAQEIQKEAELARSEGVTEISGKIVTLVGLKTDGEGDKIAALDKSIKTLVDFLTKGGEVDCVMPPAEDDVASESEAAINRKELTETFKEIRELENRQKLLEKKE